LPSGWKDRLVVIKNKNTNGIAGLCLEVHDLAIFKIVAGRSKDFEFIQELIRHDLVRKKIMLVRLAETGLQDAERNRGNSKIMSMFSN